MSAAGRKTTMPEPHEALPGRDTRMPVPARHYVNGNPLQPPFPDNLETAMLGCGTRVLANGRGIYHSGGLCGRYNTQSDL